MRKFSKNQSQPTIINLEQKSDTKSTTLFFIIVGAVITIFFTVLLTLSIENLIKTAQNNTEEVIKKSAKFEARLEVLSERILKIQKQFEQTFEVFLEESNSHSSKQNKLKNDLELIAIENQKLKKELALAKAKLKNIKESDAGVISSIIEDARKYPQNLLENMSKAMEMYEWGVLDLIENNRASTEDLNRKIGRIKDSSLAGRLQCKIFNITDNLLLQNDFVWELNTNDSITQIDHAYLYKGEGVDSRIYDMLFNINCITTPKPINKNSPIPEKSEEETSQINKVLHAMKRFNNVSMYNDGLVNLTPIDLEVAISDAGIAPVEENQHLYLIIVYRKFDDLNIVQ